MTWFKVDDKLHSHRKTRRAKLAAMGLWVVAGSWCADNLTDGFIPADVCAGWDRGYRKAATALVEAGFWVPAEKDGETGFQFHEWNAPGMQPTAESVLADRAAAAERQRRSREAAKAKRDNERTPPKLTDMSHRDSQGSNGVSHGPPDPTRPDPKGGRAQRVTNMRPDPWCPRHPGGTDIPCRPCASARHDSETWQKPTPTPPSVAELRATGAIRT